MKYKLQKNDLYPTAPSATWAALDHLSIKDTVWECAAGKGHMAYEIEQRGYKVIRSDIKSYGCKNTILDFLEVKRLAPHVKTIMTNPPYSNGMADKFIRHALELTRPVKGRVLMLLKVKFDCGSTRADIFGNCPAYCAKLILTERMLIPGFKHRAQPMDNHAWYMWDWELPHYDHHPELQYVY